MSLRVVTSSWNVYGLAPQNDNLDEWLHLLEDHHDKLADIYVIGLQEVPADPSSLMLDYYIRDDPWTRRLLMFLSTKGIVMITSARMMGLLLLVCTKPKHLQFVREIKTTYTKTAFYGLLGTKGAVSLRFDLYGESFCFTNNHFIAGEKYNQYRNQVPSFSCGTPDIDISFCNSLIQYFHSVMSKTLFPNCARPTIKDHRYHILFGDFNYRLNDLDILKIKDLSLKEDYDTLLSNDQVNYLYMAFRRKMVLSEDVDVKIQLLKSRDGGESFDTYNENKITFPPTYKYDLNTSTFDTRKSNRNTYVHSKNIVVKIQSFEGIETSQWNVLRHRLTGFCIFDTYFNKFSKNRSPAYTDRILWNELTEEVLTMEQTAYDGHMKYIASDHKPVSAEFTIQIPAMLSAEPLIEFRFDESYIPWTSEEDGICIFYSKGYKTSSWDWIGLYPIDFKSPKDYYTYEWSVSGADETGEDGCMVLFDDVPEEHGYYMFGYWSREMECVIGFSDPFHVEPVPEPDEPEKITIENPAEPGAEA